MNRGKLFGVSVGPGDPELITLKALRVMREAQVIALPHENRESCVAYQIARQAVPELEDKEVLLISMPMVKDAARLETSHRQGAARIVDCLAEGKDVALLTLGDVTVYSTCWYLYRLVREMGEEGELISGVPSFCAVAARLERALASGEEEIHILPAAYRIEQVREGLKLPGVKVLMKAGRQMGKVKEEIQKAGLSVCGVERCGMEGEKVFQSAEAIGDAAGYYSLLLVEDK